MCLSQSGSAPGNADLAASSSVTASSTLDPAHGAALAEDGLGSSFWVSKLDEVSPVTLTVELDEPAPVLEVGLNFEFVPSAFSLQTSSGAGKWTDVYSTDTNVLKTTTVPLTGHFVHGVRLVMRKALMQLRVCLKVMLSTACAPSKSCLHKCARSWSHVQ